MQAGHRAGHRDRLIANVIDPSVEDVAIAVGGFADEQGLPLVFARPRSGGGVKLEQRLATLWVVHEHGTAAAESAHLRIDHALHECARDRGIDGVAAAPHDLEANLCRERLRADDDGHARKLANAPTRRRPIPLPRRVAFLSQPGGDGRARRRSERTRNR